MMVADDRKYGVKIHLPAELVLSATNECTLLRCEKYQAASCCTERNSLRNTFHVRMKPIWGTYSWG
jgi:hypothetical protein